MITPPAPSRSLRPRPLKSPFRCAALIPVLLLSACGPDPAELQPPPPPRPKVISDLQRYQGEPVGRAIGEGRPWVAHVRAVDLDQDGRMDFVACEAKDSEVLWLRQLEDGSFEEIVIGEDMQAPVHVEAYDMNGNGHLDLLVSCMNVVFPNNDRIGALIVLENDGQQNFAKRVLLENVARVTDARAADFDRDGLVDIAVGQFGYDQGEVRWMRNLGNWEFESEILLRLSGTVNITVGDYTGNGAPDIAALVSQQWEEIHLFENDGNGNFKGRAVWGSTNDDYALSGMSSADLNRDGRPDLIFTNGDGFGPNPIPGPRPWHGVQWLENRGNGYFRYHRIADLGGAYSPVAVDIDGDGHLDVLALSSFNDWTNPKAESMVWYRNDGSMNFTSHVLAHEPIQLMTIDAADFDGSGRPSIVSGGFHAYTPYERMSRLMIWRPRNAAKP